MKGILYCEVGIGIHSKVKNKLLNLAPPTTKKDAQDSVGWILETVHSSLGYVTLAQIPSDVDSF